MFLRFWDETVQRCGVIFVFRAPDWYPGTCSRSCSLRHISSLCTFSLSHEVEMPPLGLSQVAMETRKEARSPPHHRVPSWLDPGDG